MSRRHYADVIGSAKTTSARSQQGAPNAVEAMRRGHARPRPFFLWRFEMKRSFEIDARKKNGGRGRGAGDRLSSSCNRGKIAARHCSIIERYTFAPRREGSESTHALRTRTSSSRCEDAIGGHELPASEFRALTPIVAPSVGTMISGVSHLRFYGMYTSGRATHDLVLSLSKDAPATTKGRARSGRSRESLSDPG